MEKQYPSDFAKFNEERNLKAAKTREEERIKRERALEESKERLQKEREERNRKRTAEIWERNFGGVKLAAKISPFLGFQPGEDFKERSFNEKKILLERGKQNLESWINSVLQNTAVIVDSEIGLLLKEKLRQEASDYIKNFEDWAVKLEQEASSRKQAEAKGETRQKNDNQKTIETPGDLRAYQVEQKKLLEMKQLAKNIIERYLSDPEKYLNDKNLELDREHFEKLTPTERQKVAKKLWKTFIKEYHPDQFQNDPERQKQALEIFKAVKAYLEPFL